MATIEELEKRIRYLEQRISFQDQAIRSISDFLKHPYEGGSTDYQQSKGDQERFQTESNQRMNRIMEELGYKTD